MHFLCIEILINIIIIYLRNAAKSIYRVLLHLQKGNIVKCHSISINIAYISTE